MELFFLCGFILFLSLCLASFFILYDHHKRNRNFDGKKPPLPPGNMGWPVVGETWEYLSTGWKGHPEKFIVDRLCKYSPSHVFKTCILGEKMVVMCGASGNKFIFSNDNKLVQAWWPKTLDKILLSSNDKTSPELVNKMRKLQIPSLFKLDVMQSYIPIMDTIATQHFEVGWEDKNEVKVFPLAKQYTFWLACRLFMSIEELAHVIKLEGPFNNVVSGMLSIPIDLPGTQFNRGVKASNHIKKELRGIIKQRKLDLADGKQTSTHDFLSHLLRAQDEDGKYMSEMDIANWIFGFLIAGSDTASIACTFIIKYLAELPHIYNAVYKEQMEIARSKAARELLNWEDIQKMKYSWNVACEVMRLVPPNSQVTFREAINDFMYAGFQIPKGWKLYWSANSTHKNPEYFPEPEKFDPSRFEGNGPAPYTFVPFGGGPRMCPAQEYARLEILVFMHNLVKRFKFEKILPNEKIVVNPFPVPAKGLPIRLHPHPQT